MIYINPVGVYQSLRVSDSCGETKSRRASGFLIKFDAPSNPVVTGYPLRFWINKIIRISYTYSEYIRIRIRNFLNPFSSDPDNKINEFRADIHRDNPAPFTPLGKIVYTPRLN